MKNRTIKFLPEWPLYLLGLVPIGILVHQLLNGQLGPDPARALEHELGEMALQLLIVGLAITPLWKVTGINLVKYRRAIGLIAFFYVLLHLLTYLVLDYQFGWAQIWADIIKRPYITIGMVGFLMLLPLAVTSNAAAIRRLGSQSWKKLHKLVYFIVPLGALHWVMLTKTWQLEPILYLVVSLVLVGFRYSNIDLRTRPQRRKSAPIEA